MQIGGDPLLNREINEQVQADTEQAEVVSLPITLIVMVVIFGGLLAALLPLIGAIAAVGGAFLCLLGFAAVITLDPNTVPVTTLLGLGISIDYALLMVSRFREERAAGADVPGAVERTAATAGRTIAFSALTVAVSLSALMIFDDPTFRAIGAAGVAVVVVALLAALTLVPALLALVGGRIPVRRALAPDRGVLLPAGRRGAAAGLAGRDRRRRAAARRRHAAAVAEAGERRGQPAAGLVRERPGAAEPAVALPRAPARIRSPCWLGRRRQQLDAYVAGLRPVGWTGPTWPRWRRRPGSAARRTRRWTSPRPARPRATRRSGWCTVLREHRAAVPELGRPATPRCWSTSPASLAERLPWAFGVIAVALFVLLFLMTGSVLVPVKALVMNTISLAATFGALVWVFQEGHLEDAARVHLDRGDRDLGAGDRVRVRVRRLDGLRGLPARPDQGAVRRRARRNDEAVRVGLQRSGRIITSAALLIVIVFCGFAAGRMLGIKEMGFALAVAVVVDATLVRCLLVPATMTLLGDLNWWAPAPLRRVHARIGMSEMRVPARPRPDRPAPRAPSSEPRAVREDGRAEVRPAAPTPD